MGVKTWSDDDEKELIELYTSGEMTDPYDLANYFKKGHRSVISKLVQLKIYITPKEAKPRKPTVKEMIIDLEKMLDIKIETLNLSKKEVLYTVVQAIKTKLNTQQHDIKD